MPLSDASESENSCCTAISLIEQFGRNLPSSFLENLRNQRLSICREPYRECKGSDSNRLQNNPGQRELPTTEARQAA